MHPLGKRPPAKPSLLRSVSHTLRPLQVRECPTGIFWTVRPGDTFFSIAQATGTTIEAISALNPDLDPNNLQPGTIVCLPETVALPRGPVPPCESGLYWVVAPGDTLYSIAQEYGTTVEDLLAVNPGVDPFNLQIGMSICLPQKSR